MKKQTGEIRKHAWKWMLSLGLVATLITPYPIFAEESENITPTKTAEEGNRAEARSDINAPVIDSVNFPMLGQKVDRANEVLLKVKAYDVDSGVKSVKATMKYVGKDTTTVAMRDLTLNLNQESGYYEGRFNFSKIAAVKGYISKIEVIDNVGNIANTWNPIDEGTGQYKCWFTMDELPNANVAITAIDFKQNQKTLKNSDRFDFVVSISGDKSAVSQIYLQFKNKATNGIKSFYARYDANSGRYTYNGNLNSSLTNGKWELDKISASINSAYEELTFDNKNNYWFTMDDVVVDEDKHKPTITSIEVDRNGEVLKTGDTVNIRIRATDTQALSYTNASVYFKPIANISSDSERVDLTYDETEDVFIGVLKIKDTTYPCEWVMSNVVINNTVGNSVDVNEYYPDWIYKNPFYIFVNNDGTFVNPTYKVNIHYNVINEKGKSKEIIVEKEVERRSTFKDNNMQFPDASTNFENLKFENWKDADGNIIDENYTFMNSNSVYVYAQYDRLPVKFTYNYVNKNGKSAWFDEIVILPKNYTNNDLIKFGEKHAAPTNSFKGMTFNNWKTSSQNDDKPIYRYPNISMKANYAERLVLLNYKYVNDKNELIDELIPTVVPATSTYKQVIDQAMKKNIPDMTKQYAFDKWEYGFFQSMHDVNEIVDETYYTIIEIKAAYKNVKVIKYQKDYYDVNGKFRHDAVPVFVNNGTDRSDLVTMFKDEAAPESYPGLRFEKWMMAYMGSPYGFDNYGLFRASAEYENCLVRFIIDDRFKENALYETWGEEPDYETMILVLAEYSEEVKVPTSVKGYDRIIWTSNIDDTVGTGGIYVSSYHGYGIKNSSFEPNPDVDIKPTPKPNPGTNDGIKLPSNEIDNIVNKIKGAANGDKIIVDMGNATVLPVDILEAAKGKDVDIQLMMDGYTWTINGKDIVSDNLKDINMEVKLNGNAIPNKVIQEIAGDNPTMQLSLTHNGDFGFKADLTVNVGSEYAGKYGNLFYYDSSGKLVFMNAGKINESGDVTLSFSHASDYVIVMSDEIMGDGDVIKSTSNTPISNDIYYIGVLVGVAFLSMKRNKRIN